MPDVYIHEIENKEQALQYVIETIISLHGHVDADGRVTKTHALVKWQDYDDSWNELVDLDSLVDDAPAALSEHIASLPSTPRLHNPVQQRLDTYHSSLNSREI